MDKRGAATDILFMSTRGADLFHREFTESFIRPGIGKEGWADRANYAAIGIVCAQRTASTGKCARAAVFRACRVPRTRQPAAATAARRKSANSSPASIPAPCPRLSLSRQRAFASPRCADISNPTGPRRRSSRKAPGRPLFSNWNQRPSLRPPLRNAVTTDSISRPVLFWRFRRASPPGRWPPSWRFFQNPPHDDFRRARHPRLRGARTG
jgi:hypothetical protein